MSTKSENSTPAKNEAGCFIQFIMYLVAVAVFGSGFFINPVVGIILSLVFALIIFLTPYLRRASYLKWLGWLAIGDAIWWAYCMVG